MAIMLVFVFDLVQFVADFVLNVLSGVCDMLAGFMCFFFGAMFEVVAFGVEVGAVIVVNFGCGVFCFAPGLFGGAFDLIGYTRVSELLITDSLADRLLYFSCYLIEFS